MITSVKIEGFRGVREGGVEGLAPISILVGPNNQGKSTVLEAIAAVGYGQRADQVVKLLLRRGGPPLDGLAQIVTQGEGRARITIHRAPGEEPERWASVLVTPAPVTPLHRAVALEGGLKEPLSSFAAAGASIWVDVTGQLSGIFPSSTLPTPLPAEELRPQFLVRFVDHDAIRSPGVLEDAYIQLELAGRVEMVVRGLKRAMTDLCDLRLLESHGRRVLHAFYANSPPMPVFLAGDGFKRLVALAGLMLAKPHGVLLLEDPENCLHPRYLEELAKLLHVAAREGTQIILSTQSIELIDFLVFAPEAEGQIYPAMHRMTLYEGKLRATSFSREHAVIAREELLTDLRS